jgi:site-specific recombinase XerC
MPSGQLRAMMISEFEQWLRSRTNQEKRPFQEDTILAYAKAARALDAWMTRKKIDGDFTACDAATLNRFFREYYLERGQGGTHTLQRNLIQLFNFLERERRHPNPYKDGLDDLLEVTGGGKARDFETSRDHAIIRILRSEGIRRAELLGMVMHMLPADVIRNPLFRLVPLKSARTAGEGRLVVLALRVRTPSRLTTCCQSINWQPIDWLSMIR